jgi:hypothetical protein
VREAGRPRALRPPSAVGSRDSGEQRGAARGQARAEAESGAVEAGRRGHLRILRDS